MPNVTPTTMQPHYIQYALTQLPVLLSAQETQWLEAVLSAVPAKQIQGFVACPRFVQDRLFVPSPADVAEFPSAFTPPNTPQWGLVRLVRVRLLLALATQEEAVFIRQMEQLFDTAEMNELVALYTALPLLPYPSRWLFRATEAVRSNMGVVYEALALHNAYPSLHFDQLAWNQLVMKGIFNDKPIHQILGLDERANEELAITLRDFARERWAAGRAVAPQVWRLVVGFINDSYLDVLEQLLSHPNRLQQQAGALACYHTAFVPAQQLLASYPTLQAEVQSGQLTWKNLELNDLNTYVSTP